MWKKSTNYKFAATKCFILATKGHWNLRHWHLVASWGHYQFKLFHLRTAVCKKGQRLMHIYFHFSERPLCQHLWNDLLDALSMQPQGFTEPLFFSSSALCAAKFEKLRSELYCQSSNFYNITHKINEDISFQSCNNR